MPGGDSNLETAGVFISDYTGSVEKVVNSKEIHVKAPFYLRYGPGGSHPSARYYLADFGNNPYIPESAASQQRANFTMSFVDHVPAETSSFAFDSFVDLTIKNARTFSGDVYRVRVSGGSMTRISDFPILLESVLESPQLLVDPNSPSGVKRTGYFQSQLHINQYWNTQFNVTASYEDTRFIDAVKLSGSYGGHNENASFLLDKAQTQFTVDKDVVYELSMRIFGKKGPKKRSDGSTKNEAKIFFHVSGSNIAPDNNPKYANADAYGTTIRDEHGNKVGLFLGDNDPNELNYEKISHAFTIPFKLDRISNDDTIIQLRVESGEWTIQDISLRPALDTGFSPDQFKIRVPIPTNTQRPDRFRFILNYYSQDNVEAEEISEIKDVEIQGEALLVQGDDNLLRGTVTIGNVQGSGIEMKGGNSAFIRSVPYKGFISASQHGVGGFFMWSGSVSPGGVSADNYRGSGLEIHDGNTGTDESFFKFRTIDADNNNSSSFDVRASRFFLGSETAGNFISGSLGNIKIQAKGETLISGSQVTIATPTFFLGATGSAFISGSNGNMQITSSNFHLAPNGDVTMQGTITAEAGGTIGGFSIGSDNLTATNFVLNTTNKSLSLGSGNDIFLADADTGIQLGNATFARAPFSVSPKGVIKAQAGEIGGFGLGGTTISSSNNNLILKDSGQITGSNVLFSGGTIGGFTLTSNAISSSNLLLEDSGEIKTSNFISRLQGFRISAKGNGTAEFENVRIRGTLKTTTFEKETVNAVGGRLYVANSTVLSSSISSSQTALKVENASGFEVGEIIFAKKVTGTGFSKEFMQITSISRQDPSNDTDFTGILHVTRSFGQSDFVSAPTDSGLDLNGAINATQTTLTVDQGDARTLFKDLIKIDNELMMVSGSPNATTLQVHRGVDGTAKASHSNNAQINVMDKDSAFLFGLVSPAEDYTEGQVLVSTGRFLGGTGTNTTGSGYIELNANPTTGATPFIEMVERTGSKIYDMERRLVIGDLSGFVGSAIGKRVDLPNNPGFGLASENVFLSGGIKANSGSIGGIKMVSQKIFTGTGAHGNSNTGFFASASGDFSLKDKIVFTAGSSNLSVKPNTFELDATNVEISSTNASMSLGEGKIKLVGASTSTITVGAANSITLSDDGTDRFLAVGKSSFSQFDQSTNGIILGTDNGTSKFEVVGNSNNYISFNGSSFDIKSQTFDLDATTLFLQSANSGKIMVGDASGQRTVISGSSGELAFFNSDGDERLRLQTLTETTNYVQQNGSTSTQTEKASVIQMTAGRLNITGSIAAVLDDDLTATILEGGQLMMRAQQDSSKSFSQDGTAILADLHLSSSILNLSSTGDVTGMRVQASNSGFGRAIGIRVGGPNKYADNIQGMTGRLQNPSIFSPILPRVMVISHISGFGTSPATGIHISDLSGSLKDGAGLSHASNQAIRIDETGGVILNSSGSAGNPSYAFFADFDTGLFMQSAANIGVSLAGTEEFRFASGGTFHADADVVAFSNTVSSDFRLKENIEPLTDNLQKVLKLKPSSYNWKIRDKQEDVGFIAQDVEQIIPMVVKENTSIGNTKDFLGSETHKTVDYAKIVTYLVGAIQEQQEQIDELKKKIEES